MLATLLSIGFAIVFGFDKEKVKSGVYGYNALLVGLGIGVSFNISITMLLALFLAVMLCFFITLAIEGIFYKYNLPILSIPFIVSLISFYFATKHFDNLGVNENWLFEANELYKIGGIWLTNIHDYINTNLKSISLRTYFHSLGAICFQVNILSGILISIGLLLYSRIFFIYSLVGFYSALSFYNLMGADITSLAYTYIGFNFILTAIAAGSFFLIPNAKSLLWTIIILPLVAVVTLASYHIFSLFSAPIYAIPFNVVVLLFLYILKLRIHKNIGPEFPIFQFFNPEENLYYHRNYKRRFPHKTFIDIYLPFWGKWTVSQGHEGEFTHKNAWKHAWDFVITDNNGSQYASDGKELTDYYCYNKPVVAPAGGYVVKVVDHIYDNVVGDMNLVQNWGNTVIISHQNLFFSKLSHLKAGTIEVTEGMFVHKGQVLGNCGNSGRSPYPHLHFQLQSLPDIGAHTLEYPFAHYLKANNSNSFVSYSIPKKNDVVCNIEITNLLENALNLMPGTELNFTSPDFEETILVEIDPFNNRYLTSEKYKTRAYFVTNEVQFHFSHFEGSKKSVLYMLYISLFRVQFGFYKNMLVADEFPINTIFSKSILVLHDFIAPLGNLFHSQYSIEYKSIDNETFPSEIEITSHCTASILNKTVKKNTFSVLFDKNGIKSLAKNNANENKIIQCSIK